MNKTAQISLSENINTKIKEAQTLVHQYNVQFYRLSVEKDKNAFLELISNPHIQVFDTILSQLKELIKSLFPKEKLNEAQYQERISKHLGNHTIESYGVWVYYPWLQKVVHILDEEEFIHLRTNRNQYKISLEEKEKLSKAKIGVIGLSVGQSVAMALSMERCFGELRIADFDTLDLSNLNRIRSGLQDLGHLKTVSTARQIAEIDPFLNVSCFNEGLTEANIDAFLLDNGKLDVLIDECDGFDIKILSRLKAKEAKIPVVMETSDRCMLDIERFDLEPNRPILHGLIEHLDLDFQKLKGLTMEQKFAYIIPILGVETMSNRIKASMLELEQSITTWPQLATDVLVGGAVTAHVCRRMILNTLNTSGRFFLDLEEIISPEKNFFTIKASSLTESPKNLPFEHCPLPTVAILQEAALLTETALHQLIQAAVLAPSGGNSQPWKFIAKGQQLFIQIDPKRAGSFLDYKNTGSFVAIGAAIENIRLKANEIGYQCNVQYLEEETNVAVLQFTNKKTECPLNALSTQIPERLTYRKVTKRVLIEPLILDQIKKVAVMDAKHQMILVDKAADLEKLAVILGKIDRLLLTHPKGHQGFNNEIRWNDAEAKNTKDGIDIATAHLSAGEVAAFKMAQKWPVIALLNQWKGGAGFEKMTQNLVRTSSAMALLTLPDQQKTDYLSLGQSLQRVWLKANQLGIALQPISPITFLYHRLKSDPNNDFSPENIHLLNALAPKFNELFGLKSMDQAGFLFRLLIPEGKVIRSYRRDLEDVFKIY